MLLGHYDTICTHSTDFTGWYRLDRKSRSVLKEPVGTERTERADRTG